MPWKVKKGTGSKPWKIIRADTGQVVGSSKTKAQAMGSVRARYASEPGLQTSKTVKK